MEYENELALIQKMRKDAYTLSPLMMLCIVVATISQVLFPVLTPVFTIILFAMFYNRINVAAHAPCPRCHEPYGSKSKLVFGVGGNSCQNCGLELDGLS